MVRDSAQNALCAAAVLRLTPAPTSTPKLPCQVGGFTHAQALEARAATSKMAGSKPVHTALQVKLLRYIAPESFAHDMWNEKSDVWSFGVLLWEVATMGAPPYASHGVEAADIQVATQLGPTQEQY